MGVLGVFRVFCELDFYAVDLTRAGIDRLGLSELGKFSEV
jgi:hypothetical protein